MRVPQDADGGVIEINVPIYLFLPADSWESDAGGGVSVAAAEGETGVFRAFGSSAEPNSARRSGLFRA